VRYGNARPKRNRARKKRVKYGPVACEGEIKVGNPFLTKGESLGGSKTRERCCKSRIRCKRKKGKRLLFKNEKLQHGSRESGLCILNVNSPNLGRFGGSKRSQSEGAVRVEKKRWYFSGQKESGANCNQLERYPKDRIKKLKSAQSFVHPWGK